MSNGVTVKIGTKYDSKGMSDFKNSLNSLHKNVASITNVFKGFIGLKVIQGMNNAIKASTETFKANNTAQTKLFTSLSNNAKIAKEDIQDLTKEVFGMSGLFGGDQLVNSASILSNYGLDKTQMKEALNVAQDLASAGIMPLEQACKALGQSYGGNITQLKKMCPELANLTKEDLKNGEAVKILQERYKGFSDAMKNTFSGRESIINDTLDGIKDSVGKITQSVKFLIEGKLMKPLKDVQIWFEENSNKILSFIAHLPEILKTTSKFIMDIMKETFTGEGMTNLFSFLGKLLLESIKLALVEVLSLVKSLFITIQELLDVSLGNLTRLMNNAFVKIGNSILEGVNKLLSKIMDNKVMQFLYKQLSGNDYKGEVITFKFQEKQIKSLNEAMANIKATWVDTGQTVTKGLKDFAKTQKENLNSFTSFYSNQNQEFAEEIQKILKSDLPEELKNALTAGLSNGQATPLAETNPITGATSSQEINNPFLELINSLGQIGVIIKAIMESNPIGILIEFIAKFITKLSESSEAFNKVLNVIDTLIEAILNENIINLVDQIFTPIAQMIERIGAILGTVLQPILEMVSMILEPILSLASELLDSILAPLKEILTPVLIILKPIVQIVSLLANVLKVLSPVLKVVSVAFETVGKILMAVYNYLLLPVVNFLLKIISSIGNFFVRMYNGVVRVLKKINVFGWRPFSNMQEASLLDYDSMKLEKVSLNSYDSSTSGIDIGTGTNSSTSSSASNSAHYTAAKDIYVTIQFNQSYVNGDAREIALMLREEIRMAEKLGY